MRYAGMIGVVAVFAGGCVSDSIATDDPLEDYEELNSAPFVDAPAPEPGRYSAADRDAIDRGEYLVELLGCGSCHTDGAFDGAPDMTKPLAGSHTGIAFTNPLDAKRPGVAYPPNITPDEDTGIGLWSDTQIANAIRAGVGQHGSRRLVTMPWQGYAKLNDDDVEAIVAYLRSIEPVEFDVPGEVRPGRKATHSFVYFGVYRSRQ